LTITEQEKRLLKNNRGTADFLGNPSAGKGKTAGIKPTATPPQEIVQPVANVGVETPTGSIKTSENITKQFSSFVDSWKNDKFRKVESFKFDSNPQIFKILGHSVESVHINDGVLRKATSGEHTVGIEELKKIPSELSRPLAVFDSKEPNSKVFLTEIIDANNKKVIVPVELTKKFNGWEVANIKNAYGKDNPDIFNKWVKGGLLKYYDTKRVQSWLKVSPEPISGSYNSNKLNPSKVYTEKDLSQDLFNIAGATALTAGLASTANADTIKYKQGDKLTSEASTYGWNEKLNDKRYDGGKFNKMDVAGAMRNIPMGSKVKVTDQKTGKSITVTINDGGPAHKTKRQIDLTQGAWRALGYTKPGLTNVDVEVLSLGEGKKYIGHSKPKPKYNGGKK
jgi:rare lipoprotein A